MFQPHKVSQRVAMWEKKVMEERTSQIFKGIQRKKLEAAKEAEEAEHKHEQLWIEQGSSIIISGFEYTSMLINNVIDLGI